MAVLLFLMIDINGYINVPAVGSEFDKCIMGIFCNFYFLSVMQN